MRRGARALLLCGLLAGLAGCGSGGDDAPTTTASTDTVPAATMTGGDAAATTGPPPAPTADPDAGVRLETVASGLERPVAVASPPGDDRLFVVEQVGRVSRVEDGAVVGPPVLDLTAEVSRGNEQGLLGLAFDPAFAENGFFYVNYTDAEGTTRIVRHVLAGDSADPAFATEVLAVEQPYENHNGGHLAFGPDDMLYIGLGDGGSAWDPEGRSQDPDELLGKMLRIDVHPGESGDGAPYAAPEDNPFAGGDGRPEIWATGLRNPWRYSFDTETGDLWIGDVGQDQLEEVDRVEGPGEPGANYGWDVMEGDRPVEDGASPPPGHVVPVVTYGRDEGCSVTGGVVVRDPDLPALVGRYLYGDYCTGRIWSVDAADPAGVPPVDETDRLGGPHEGLTSFGVDGRGRVYLTVHGGDVERLAAG